MSLIDNLGDAIERNAKNLPDEIFISCDGRDVTFASFAARVRQLGSACYRGGARKQDRVAILAMNGSEYVEAYGLAEVCGFILVLVNFRLAGPEVEWILNDSQPSVLIFESGYADLVDELRTRCKTITQFICIGKEKPPWAVDYESYVASGDPAGPPFRATANDFVSIIYTSGTTGRPKGVLCRHKQPISLGLTQAIEHGSAIGTAALIIMPLFHQGARSIYLAQMLRGGRLVIHRSFDPEAALASIQNDKIAISALVPSMLQLMLELHTFDRYDLSTLQSVISFGSAMPVPLLRRAISAFGPVFSNGYGQTEGGNTVLRRQYLVLEGNEEALKRVGSVGQPLMHTEMRIIGDDGEELPPCGHGEICLRGDQVMDGYWNNHAATLDAIRDGWLHTGDIGYIGKDNFLYVVDRMKDMIISGGENIYSPEVESALISHPEVQEASVIGLPDEKWGETVCAIVVRRPGSSFSGADLIAFARSMIASYKCPKTVIFVDELPHVPTGKVDKVALRHLHR
ncbi:AMP-binding protein [Sphingomonas paeninsulae]|nr:AMP-binding protein [Sphingomonas paeninsulae]